ncbi:hypothetical protein HQ590_00725, partial [bacterium]|nr:hypothetical protein [bacterium]
MAVFERAPFPNYDPFFLQTQYEIIQSRKILYRVIERFDLQHRWANEGSELSVDLAFRQLKDLLAKEGLFDPGRKKPIPRYPRHIAVVTSATGAAVSDIFKTIKRRFPCVTVSLYPVRVQGEGAAREIAEAVGRLSRCAAT